MEQRDFEIEVLERLAKIEVLLQDVPDLKNRVRRLEIAFVALACSVGGFEFIMKVMG